MDGSIWSRVAHGLQSLENLGVRSTKNTKYSEVSHGCTTYIVLHMYHRVLHVLCRTHCLGAIGGPICGARARSTWYIVHIPYLYYMYCVRSEAYIYVVQRGSCTSIMNLALGMRESGPPCLVCANSMQRAAQQVVQPSPTFLQGTSRIPYCSHIVRVRR